MDILNFAARGGELTALVFLVPLVYLVFLVGMLQRASATSHPRRSLLALAISYTPFALL